MLQIAQDVVEGVRGAGKMCATAESCTGGGIGAAITAVPGSSEMFAGGVISYSNEVKRDVLGVPQATLDAHGAVSAETARAMAEGARRLLKVDAAVAVTGVAGPGGGSPQKPVGTVWFGLATAAGSRAEMRRFDGDRDQVRAQTVVHALELLNSILEKA